MTAREGTKSRSRVVQRKYKIGGNIEFAEKGFRFNKATHTELQAL